MRASAQGGSVMITGRELSDCGGEFAAELRALGGRSEADLGVDGERGEALAGFARAGSEFADFADDTRRQRDEIARRQAVAAAPGVGRRGAHGGGGHYIRRRGGFHQALRDAAPLAFAGWAHQVVALQGAQVVVHFLAWKGEARGKGGGRSGLRQFGQESRADRVERGGGGL